MRDCEPVSKKYYKHSAAVTSLAFSPSDPHHFVVGTENGAIKRYDMRMPPRPTGSVWGAHGNKAVTDLKWRGSWEGEWMENGSSGWMASAGADRTVQVSPLPRSSAEARYGICLQTGRNRLHPYTLYILPTRSEKSHGDRQNQPSWPLSLSIKLRAVGRKAKKEGTKMRISKYGTSDDTTWRSTPYLRRMARRSM